VSERDWFRSSGWDPSTAAAFEQRLRRARPYNRAQYIRIQATHLLPSMDAATRESGRGLLRRVIDEYPDHIEAKSAWEQLGDSLAREGKLDEAEHALNETIRLCYASRIGRSGTTGTTELRLAEVILAGGDQHRIDEVARLLEAAQPEVQSQWFLRDVAYRYLLARARTAHAHHDPTARGLARQALATASENTPALPRHPTVGRPSATDQELTELRAIAEHTYP
jgi:hypothetical protein